MKIDSNLENGFLNQNECLICLEECDNFINFECCGKYKIHTACYNKWNETNKTCLICRNPVNPNNTFIIYYLTLFRIKLLIYIYCSMFFTSCLLVLIICEFKDSYCILP